MAETGIQEIIEFSPWAKVKQALRQVWRGWEGHSAVLSLNPISGLFAIQPQGQKVTSLVLANCSLVEGNRSWLHYVEKVSSSGVTSFSKENSHHHSMEVTGVHALYGSKGVHALYGCYGVHTLYESYRCACILWKAFLHLSSFADFDVSRTSI